MNSLRTNYEGYTLTSDMVNKYWLLGFVEGDNSFHFTISKARFSIYQKDKQVLEAIATFLQNINISPSYNNLFVPGKPKCILLKRLITIICQIQMYFFSTSIHFLFT